MMTLAMVSWDENEGVCSCPDTRKHVLRLPDGLVVDTPFMLRVLLGR